jgi:integrase
MTHGFPMTSQSRVISLTIERDTAARREADLQPKGLNRKDFSSAGEQAVNKHDGVAEDLPGLIGLRHNRRKSNPHQFVQLSRYLRRQHKKGQCVCGCIDFRETSRFGFVIYDFRQTFATRAAESGMPVVTLAAILGHADLRSVMKYVHVRQESQDRETELFEAKNISEATRWSGFGPVENAENREIEGLGEKHWEGLSNRKIN